MDRQRGERQGDRTGDGGGRRPRMSSRWSSPGSPPGSHHRYPNHSRGGGDGFSGGGGGGGGRHHPYRHPDDYPPPPRGGGSGPGFRGGPGGFGNQMPMGGGGGPRRGGGFSGRGGSSPDYNEGSNFAKLFIGSVPRTATEGEIRPLFEEHGDVLEVAFIKDKRTGQQQGCCFVKYATAEEADRAIRALHNQYTLPGGLGPIQVRYADGERERLVEHKLFVGAMNKQATEKEIEEIFSPYGRVEDVYIMRDDLKQSRGCGFVKFSNREMALAAMNALNGTYVMRGCEQPLIVRFADPKRPRPGDTRGGPAFGGPGFGPRSQAPFAVRPTQGIGESFGGRMPPNAWPPISPQSMGPSSQADADGYGKGGLKAVSSASHDNLGAPVGATNGSIVGIGTNSSQQGFNPSMAQPELTGQQISPAQKPLMSPQNLLPSIQLHQAQQTLASQPQNLRASMNQFGQHQIPQSVGSSSSQGLPSQQLMGLGSQLASSQHLVQTNPAASALQTPLGLQQQQQQGMPGPANQQQLPASSISQMLQQPIQQLPSQLSQALLQQQAQSLQSSFQSSQQAISRIQQQLQLMQQSSQQQNSQTTKQQIAPQATSGGPAGTTAARMPSTVSSTLPLAGTQPLAPLTCNWSEHTSPEGYKYYYNSVSKESKWEKPEELTVFEQQQQQQQKLLLLQQHQLKVAAQHVQLPSQTQPHTQIQSNQLAQSQVQQAQAQMQLNQQAQLQLLQPSLMYQASAAAGHQNIQDINYSQLQGPSSVIDPARTQQGAQAAQDWMWKNKPAGS